MWKEPESEFQFRTQMHVSCVLLLDRSSSMSGKPIDELNKGLAQFRQDLSSLSEVNKGCIDLAVISFGSDVTIDHPFSPAGDFQPSTLMASGNTAMGQAINLAIEETERTKNAYKTQQISYWRPWICCITDGGPNDEGWQAAKTRLREYDDGKHCVTYCFGTQGYNKQIAQDIFKRVFELNGTNFSSIFEFLSASLASVRDSNDGVANSTLPSDIRQVKMGE